MSDRSPAKRVRRLGTGDVQAMSEVFRLFRHVFDDPIAFDTAPPSEDYLKRLLDRDGFAALAAFEGDKAVGALCAYRLDKYEQQRSEYYIYDLEVIEEARRRGVATALIEELGRIAADEGAYVMFVQADHGDDPAVALYAKLGRREDVLHFDIDPAR
jgi:aminoglycoside 3-N-acetyltransferase I